MIRRMARQKTTLIDPDVQLLQALAHPTRLAIVRELIGTSEVCACDFTSLLRRPASRRSRTTSGSSRKRA